MTNQEHVKEIDKHSFWKRKAKNIQHGQEIDKQSFRKRKANKPEHITQINRNAKVACTRDSVDNLCVHVTAPAAEMQFENAQHQSPTATDNGELEGQQNKHIVISMINLFHNNIKYGLEYVCACCDQLWYQSSVVKCDANKYKACSQNVVESFVTGLGSVDNFEWICRTRDSNLKNGKLPSCSKTNKMTFLISLSC